MKTIAVCLNIPELNDQNTWRNDRILAKYPGVGFLPYLANYGFMEKVNILAGSEVLSLISAGALDPMDVYVLCEENNYYGLQLVMGNCRPMAVYCLESPLYTDFYTRLEQMKAIWKNQILFGKLGTHQAFFPSYDCEALSAVKPWDTRRKDLCVVMSNKYVASPDPNELQTLRYSALSYFKGNGMLDLYGKGWTSGEGIEVAPGRKTEVMNEYRYALCFENYVMPGYVTEKIIDCFVSGTIPIYRGTDDVHEMIPPDCFWDAKYRALPDIESLIKTDYEVNRLPEHALEFLSSDAGKRFSYQAFARMILDMVL